VLLLIEGRAHAYIYTSSGCSKWDTCAPEAILHAVGGCLTDMHGNTYTYEATVNRVNTGGTLATALASEHQWYLDKIWWWRDQTMTMITCVGETVTNRILFSSILYWLTDVHTHMPLSVTYVIVIFLMSMPCNFILDQFTLHWFTWFLLFVMMVEVILLIVILLTIIWHIAV